MFSHNQAKGEFAQVLGPMVKAEDLGYFVHDRMLLTHLAASLSTEPDGLFVSHAALDAGRVTWVESASGGDPVELIGSPDVVLEVVSDSSVLKDTVELMDAYFRAGVTEYWLVDARGDMPEFRLLKRGPAGFVDGVPDADVWLVSTVFGRSFRLTSRPDRRGRPRLTLEVRP